MPTARTLALAGLAAAAVAAAALSASAQPTYPMPMPTYGGAPAGMPTAPAYPAAPYGGGAAPAYPSATGAPAYPAATYGGAPPSPTYGAAPQGYPMSPTGAPAYRAPGPGGATPTYQASKYAVRCTKLRDRAQVTNVGNNVIPQGARVDVYMYEPGSSQFANGTGLTNINIAPGQNWLHPIKYSMTADHCIAAVTHDPGDVPL